MERRNPPLTKRSCARDTGRTAPVPLKHPVYNNKNKSYFNLNVSRFHRGAPGSSIVSPATNKRECVCMCYRKLQTPRRAIIITYTRRMHTGVPYIPIDSVREEHAFII